MSKRKYSFPPVVDDHAEFLILGSMPGERSLQEQQYYAHPQNLFWPFMQELFAIERSLPYQERLQALQNNRIALWDVMQHCERRGSLDSDIKHEAPNDFGAFLTAHPRIRKIGFNGQKAFRTFSKHVLLLHPAFEAMCTRLPSTSPAHASVPRSVKLGYWRQFFAG